MSGRDDGGHAFPTSFADPIGGTFTLFGMSLRDWFAGQALAGLLAMHAHPAAGGIGRAHHNEVAARAYAIADAMLAEREGES